MNLALPLSIVAMMSYAALFTLVMRRGLRLRVNLLFALYLMLMLVWQCAYIIVSVSQTASGAFLGYRLVIASATGQFILFSFFVRALLRLRIRPGAVLLGGVVWLISVVAGLVDQAHLITALRFNQATSIFVPEWGPLLFLIATINVAFLAYGIISLAQGYQRATLELERNRLRYLLLAVVIILLGTAANVVPGLVGYPIDVVTNIIGASLLSYAILRYRLLDITVVMRRGLAYTLLITAIALSYLLGILLFEFLSRSVIGSWAFFIPVVLAILATILLRPLRERALAWIDRYLFREKYSSMLMLRELSRRTAAVIDLQTLGDILLSEICRAMRLRHAVLFLRRDGTGDYYVATEQGLAAASCPRLGPDHPVVQWLRLWEQPLRSRDLELLPQFRSLWHEEKEALRQLDAELFVPLLSKDGLVGILAVGGRLGRGSLSSEDEVTLVTVANQTAVAVENARLFAATRARVAELTALQEAGVRLVSSHDLPGVLRAVAESAIRLLSAHEAYVTVYQADRGYWLTHGATADGQERALAWDSPEGLAIRAAQRSTRPTLVEDLRLAPMLQPQEVRESRVRGCCIQPLRRGDATIGALAVLYYEPRTLSEEETRLLSMLADHASLAIENARLLQSEQARRQLADTLREMSRVIGSTLDLDLVLELVLEQLKNVVHYDSAIILLLTDDRLQVSNARGVVPRARILGATFPVGLYAFFDGLLTKREPVVIDDITVHNPGFGELEGFRARSVIAVPLVVRDEPRGILTMGSAEPAYYTADDVQNALAFANQAAIAIENARLYQETIEEKRKTETILRETFSGIVVTDVDLRVVSFNAGAEAITGYKAADVLGKYLPDVLGPHIASPDSPLGQAMVSGQRVSPQETVVPTANGMRDVLQGSVALRDGDGTPFGYLLSLADITRLKEVDRLKSDIVANVSHELRTPLASIKAYAELLLHNVEGDDRELRDQFLEIIDIEADRLSQLISDLLNLSRLEAGRFEVRKVPIDMGTLLSDVLMSLEVQRRSQQVTIRIDAPADLPKLKADREMAAMIVKNLAGNAIKFSRRGGEVTLSLRAEDGWLALQVIDHGIGIPSEAIPHLFQKFYRAPVAAEAGIEGTGLGLVLVKQAVEAHGGTIGVESQLGVGTTFTVRLPLE